MNIDEQLTGKHVESFANQLQEFSRLNQTLETFQQPEKWREIVGTFFRYRILLKKLMRLDEDDLQIISQVNQESGQIGADAFLKDLGIENRQKLITSLNGAMDPNSPTYLAALEELRAMMQNGQEIFDAGEKPRDGDPKSDAAIWGFTQIGPEHVETQMHFIVCHFLERFMTQIYREAGVETAQHKDYLLNSMVDVLVLNYLKTGGFEKIFQIWNTKKENGGLGWINQEKLKHYKNNLLHNILEKYDSDSYETEGVQEIQRILKEFKRIKQNGMYAGISYLPNDNKSLKAIAYIEARGKGDEILLLMARMFQNIADKYQLPIIHLALPGNIRATKLFERTNGYKKIPGTDYNGNYQWKKAFFPK